MHLYLVAFLLYFQSFVSSKPAPDVCSQQSEDTQAVNLIFQSADGGQTWQDVSAGLPATAEAGDCFASDAGLYLRTEHGLYRSNTASKAPVWEKESLPDDHGATVLPGRARLLAHNSGGLFFQKVNGTTVWSPLFTIFGDQLVRTIFETTDGTLFVGCDNGIFKSADQGITWKHVFDNGWMIEMVESDGVLICTNQNGILRSTDGGEHWDIVISEGGVGIAVERIAGGFAAITYNTTSRSRRVRTSADGGKTWQPIDAGLPPSELIASIKQVGEYFFCGHPDGIFRSSNRGKTWERVLPSIGDQVFNLSVWGNVIYAVPRNGGC